MNEYQKWFERMASHEPVYFDDAILLTFKDCAFRIMSKTAWAYTQETWAGFGYKKFPFDKQASNQFFKKNRLKYIIQKIEIFCAIAGASIYALEDLDTYSLTAYMAELVVNYESYSRQEQLARDYHLSTTQDDAIEFFKKLTLLYAQSANDEELLCKLKKRLEVEGLSGKVYNDGAMNLYNTKMKEAIETFRKVKITDISDYPPLVKPNTLLD